MKLIYLYIIGLCFVFSCETTQLELLEDPNAIALSNSDPDFFLNSIEIEFARFFEGVQDEGGETTRMYHMFGPLYQNAYNAAQFNTQWSTAYSTILSDVRSLTALGESQGLFTHIGIGQVIESYVMITLVDYFGDVPYSQSNVAGIVNPETDTGQSIYAEMLTLLDTAIDNFNKSETVLPTNDFFYDGDEAKWIALANTLKLRIYLQSRLVDPNVSTTGINGLIASGSTISSEADDFQFQWGKNIEDPDARHPRFTESFTPNNPAGGAYMSNYLMTVMNGADLTYKTIIDPRINYYFYRQGNKNATNTNEQDCFGALPPEHYGFIQPFCTTDFPGYWGRDHGDDSGIPPDSGLKAAYGVYPFGADFDSGSFTSITSNTIGLAGAGISPIMLSSFVDFMLAESALTLGTTGSPLTLLQSGIQKSMDKVFNFGSEVASNPPTQANIDTYIQNVTTAYMNASSDDERLNIIISEYQLAAFGNGVESFNAYRRTGKPDNLQPLREADTDMFLRSFFYPANAAANNANIDQKLDVTDRVFWDTNPTNGFIN